MDRIMIWAGVLLCVMGPGCSQISDETAETADELRGGDGKLFPYFDVNHNCHYEEGLDREIVGLEDEEYDPNTGVGGGIIEAPAGESVVIDGKVLRLDTYLSVWTTGKICVKTSIVTDFDISMHARGREIIVRPHITLRASEGIVLFADDDSGECARSGVIEASGVRLQTASIIRLSGRSLELRGATIVGDDAAFWACDELNARGAQITALNDAIYVFPGPESPGTNGSPTQAPRLIVDLGFSTLTSWGHVYEGAGLIFEHAEIRPPKVASVDEIGGYFSGMDVTFLYGPDVSVGNKVVSGLDLRDATLDARVKVKAKTVIAPAYVSFCPDGLCSPDVRPDPEPTYLPTAEHWGQ